MEGVEGAGRLGWSEGERRGAYRVWRDDVISARGGVSRGEATQVRGKFPPCTAPVPPLQVS